MNSGTKRKEVIAKYDTWQQSRNLYVEYLTDSLDGALTVFFSEIRYKGKKLPDSVMNFVRIYSKDHIELYNPAEDFDNFIKRLLIEGAEQATLCVIRKTLNNEEFNTGKFLLKKFICCNYNKEQLQTLYSENRENFTKYVEILIAAATPTLKVIIKSKMAYLGADIEDLIQSGYERVLERVWQYNPHKNCVSTYFSSQLSYCITKEAYHASGVDEYTYESANKLQSIAKRLGYEEGLADSNLDSIMLAKVSGKTLTVVDAAIRCRMPTSSLDNKISYNQEDDMQREIEDVNVVQPEDYVLRNEQHNALKEKLKKLSKIDRTIVLEIANYNGSQKAAVKAACSKINNHLDDYGLNKPLKVENVMMRFVEFTTSCKSDKNFVEVMGRNKIVSSSVAEIEEIDEADGTKDNFFSFELQ